MKKDSSRWGAVTRRRHMTAFGFAAPPNDSIHIVKVTNGLT